MPVQAAEMREATLSPGTLLRNLGFVVLTLPVAWRKARRELEQAVRLTRELGMGAWLGRSLLALGLLCQAKDAWRTLGDTSKTRRRRGTRTRRCWGSGSGRRSLARRAGRPGRDTLTR